MASLHASIIVIGDEILGGFVADTNSGWLAGRLRAHGVPLDRIATVPDDIGAIGEALTVELGRSRPRLILTSGGIGSTPDDVTFAAIAQTLHQPLELHPELDARLATVLSVRRAAGGAVATEQAEALRKMARVPAGTYLLSDREDLSPGTAVDVGGGSRAEGVTIVALPGIPGQLRRIVREDAEPALLAGRGRHEHCAELMHDYPESLLTPVLEQLVGDFPDVHVGSYPGRECLVRLRGPRERVEQAARIVRDRIDALAGDPGTGALRREWQAGWRDPPPPPPPSGDG